MEKDKETPVFSTQSVDLASFLILEGIKFLGCEKSENNPGVVVFNFEDHTQSCLDLDRVFLSSDFKKYRDINKWLLQRVHQTLRS